MDKTFDIGIIGGGPAGYTAAFKARELGLSVVLFEKENLGGVCLNKGCIPTKAILHSAELYEEMKCSQDLGILAENISFDYSKVVERKDKIVEKLRKGLELSLKNAGVIVINAEAQANGNLIKANGENYECSKVICAVGSEPKDFPNLRFDHKFVLNSDDILAHDHVFESIAKFG